MSDDMITLDPAEGGATRRRLLTGLGAAAAGGGLIALAGAQNAHAAVDNATYSAFEPFRIIDTRVSGGRISGGQTRTLSEFEDGEGFAAAINLTVTDTKGSGYLSIFNADEPRPRPYSSVNWKGAAGKTVANFNIVVAGDAGLAVYCSNGSTHFIIDVVGIFITAEEPVPAPVRAYEKKMRSHVKG